MANQELSSSDGGPSQLKIVLLGGRNSGKSCVGNVLLGREEFATRERTTCSRQQALVAGRRVSVVDTPGWWCDFGTRDTAQLVKTEIAGSVLLCSPGPHVFLVVVKACSPFSEQRRVAVEQHVSLLGETVWRHCIVVLTCVDGRAHGGHDEWPGRRESSALWWLVDKCDGRCQRLVLTGGTGGGKAPQLFDEVLRLEAENANRPFVVEPSCLRGIQQGMKTVEERALGRFLRMKRQRTQMQEEARPLSDLRLVVAGPTGSGKTSVLHAILGGGDAGRPAGGRTARCQVHRARAFHRDITAVDTPGWWTNYCAAESSAFDRRELARSARLCAPGPHAVLLVLRADRAFSDSHRRAAREHLELLLGPGVWGRTLLVFSFGDWLCDASVERFVESEGAALGWLVDRCGDRYHVMSKARTAGAAGGSQAAELLAKVEEMVAADGRGCAPLPAGLGGAAPEEQRRGSEERAGRRLLEKSEQRRALRSQLEKLSPLPEVTLVLLGGRNSGRTSCGDTILGQSGFQADPSCSERRALVRGVAVTVLAPPHSPPSPDDPDPPMTPREVVSGLSALLLVVNVSAAFTSSLLEALEKQLLVGGAEEEVLGEEQAMRWGRAMVLFSHGEWLGDTSIEERIESEGPALRRLVDRCGNRYHVLDNLARGGPDQVLQLLDQVQEMLAGARLASLQRGGLIRGRASPSGGHREHGPETFRRPTEVREVSLPRTNSAEPRDHPTGSGLRCRAVPRRGRPRSVLKVYIDMTNLPPHAAAAAAAAISPGPAGRSPLRWTAADVMTALGILPSRRSSVPPRARLEEPSEGGVSTFPPRHRESLLASPDHQRDAPTGAAGDAMATRSRPAPRDNALRQLFADGDLQALIDQWGSSSLEELEAFVDAHFEMEWERAMASSPADDVTEMGGASEEAEPNTVSSIEEKLSKLHLLDNIRTDLEEMKHSLEKCWKVMQELMEAHKRQQHRAEGDSQNVTQE